MKIDSFWPPQRSAARAGAEVYRRRHPDEPWLTRQSISLLRDLLKPSDRCLEWGSGTSTAWFAHRVGTLVSVEHDPAWLKRVQDELTRRRESADVRLLSTSPQQPDGTPPYVSVIDEFDDGGLDVCFVDGELRAECVLAAIPKLTIGGLLTVDDAHGVLDHPTASPHARAGRGPVSPQWAQIAELVRDWRLMWTSDGYSDTAIWIKPAVMSPE